AIQRLRGSRGELKDRCERQGFEDGAAFVIRDADYDTIQWFVRDAEMRNRASYEITSVEQCLWSDGEMRDWVEQYCDPREWDADVLPSDWTAYWAGFEQGVLDVWERIKDEVEE
ncbi:MAG: hypothetical protein ACYTGV_09745, partial [Planctomycetota bacterium]